MKHPDTGVYWYRKRVPDHLRGAMGKREIKRSLGTKDLREAKRLFPSVAEEVERQLAIAAGEVRAVRLSMRQITGLAGEWYRAFLAKHEPDPQPVEEYDALRDAAAEAHEMGRIPEFVKPYLDPLLAEHRLVIDAASRRELGERLFWEAVTAWSLLAKRTAGDYSPDPHLLTLPQWEAPAAGPRQPRATAALPFDVLLDAWQRDADPRPETVRMFTRYLAALHALLGHDDATRVTRGDMVAFKEARLATGLTPRTVANELGGCRAVFGWAVKNDKLTDNPAAKVEVAALKAAKRRGEDQTRFPYTDAEAVQILQAARKETSATLRWLPWLAWATGARISELSGLNRADVEEIAGHWYIAIGGAGERVKTASSRRRVPLHPALIAEGFLDFVRGVPEGRLFRGERTDNPKRQDNVVSQWVRKVAGVTDPQKAPSHSWRHRFEDEGRKVRVADEHRDALAGHANPRVSAKYGHGWQAYSDPELLTIMAEEIARYRLPPGL